MIKRTTGRLLLLLLVVTGFAGTINNNAISKAERKYAAAIMKETYKAAIGSVNGLSDAQLTYKAAPDKWSVKECIYHIAGAEKLIWTMFEEAMKSPANPEKRSEIKITDEQFVKMVQDRTADKAQAPEPIQPKNTGYENIDAALTDFKVTRMEHIKYIKNTTEDMRNHVVEMPFGYIDCYQLYLLIGAHSNRHTQQMNEVKTNAGFPTK